MTTIEPAEMIKTTEAVRLTGMNRHIIYKMIELGYFTDSRISPLSAKSNRRIYRDEIELYMTIANGHPVRIRSAMKRHRKKMGRM